MQKKGLYNSALFIGNAKQLDPKANSEYETGS